MAVESITTQLVSLHILPDLVRRHSERVNIAIVGLAIVEDYVASLHLGAIDLLVAHGLGDESIKFADHRVSSVRVHIPLAQRVGDLSEPGLTSDHLWVYVIVGNDIHVIPPTIEQVVVVLIVHAHVEHVHSGQMASGSRADHLTVVDDAEV